ncbi:MAG: ATP-dependent protease LonB [Thermoplasmata archaeon]|nr:ATP-dependent protease LonB [Thermoplasmata archaeon]MBR4685548.1 ATP-dependent protease LonB [Candidatus Methanomethylophilaceae archaeon]WII07093.1 ATP-dependent protease LonB [Methanomassiliicoccales archaeon LGM-RCC1]
MTEDKKKVSKLSVEAWVDAQTFNTTDDIEIPNMMADRVIGQDRAVEIMKKAASQKRHVMLIGEPGTGKSMLANSMVEYLSKEALEDIVAYHNPEDFNEPRIRVFPAGKGKAVVNEQKAAAAAQKNQKNSAYIYVCIALLILGLIGAMYFGYTIALLAFMGVFLILMLYRSPMQQRTEVAIVPKVLVGHDPGDMPPFVDATGTHAGALLGDVRHDPFQSGGLETPSHDRIEAGCIHKANKGVLYIDEINLLRIESQQAILTAMQEKKMSITGQSERSSGALVKSEPVPCDFILVCAGNLDAIQGMHPALRSRIRGYGYEVFMETNMPDTDENRQNIVRFVAQEVKKDEKIPAFDKYAVGEILKEGQRRSGKKGEITLRMRELGGLIRIAGDMAVNNGDKVVTSEHVMLARETARSLEQQIADKQIEGMMRYQLFHNSGEAVGLINGLAVLSNGNSSEMSGMVMPLAAEVTPAQSKKGGKIIATGQLGKIAQEAVDNISAVIKKYTLTDLSALDIHIEYVAAYNGVDGDSASVTMATVIISALENIPIRQDLAMTGSLNVRGTVMPIGGVTAKLEAAANSGIKVALIPKENEKDVMIDRKYYDMMEIYTMQTLRDVFEYAFVDCPAKQKYLDALLPLNPSGESTAEKVKIPPKYKKDRKRSKVAKKEPVAEEAETVAEPEEVEVTVEVESED